MRKEYTIAANGQCALRVKAFTQQGEFCDNLNVEEAEAFIDITAQATYIKKELADKLELKPKTSKNDQQYGLVGINIQDIWGNGGIGLHAFVVDETLLNYDIVLGSDFLANVNFERRGKDSVFALSSL